MAGINGISTYQQANQLYRAQKPQPENNKNPAAEKTGLTKSTGWSPIDPNSSLVPRSTEYGNTIGDVKLSDKAKDYYEKLKSKYHNMEFIAVSKDMKAQVQQNVTSYGNANKMVVLIDDEKLERMAEDDSYRKKYEGIIQMSQTRLSDMKNSLASSGASVRSFGMSVDSNGNESFFASVDKTNEMQKERIEKKAAEKKEQKIHEKKKAEKAAREERIQKARDERKAEKTDGKPEKVHQPEKNEPETFQADTMEDLLSKVRDFTYENASGRVMTGEEMMLGSHVDFKG